MLRGTLLYLSNNRQIRYTAENFNLAQRMSSRFVAGTTMDDAVRVVRDLNKQGSLATLDHLGESVETEQDARRAAQDYLDLLDRGQQTGIQSNVSLKLTHFGINIRDELAYELVASVVDHARQYGNFVRIDMENHPYTDRTLAIYRRLREAGYANTGVVIQSYLYRSQNDIRNLMPLGLNVRLCKGAYLEPEDVAFPQKKDVDANYVALAKLLLSPEARAQGVYPAGATHDSRMIEIVQLFAAAQKLPKDSYEFQMLYGVRRDLQRELVKAGHKVRVYVPYGREWYPYFMRRLAERPANLWFFLSNFFKK